MRISAPFIVCITLLIGNSLAAPIFIESSDELVARITHAEEAAAVHAQIHQHVNPKKNTSVFWSGEYRDANGKMVSAGDHARQQEKASGRETLEDHLHSKGIHIPDRNPESRKLWLTASTVYAERSKGEVHTYLGTHQSPHSVYNTLEKPALMNNPHVKKVTEHQLPHGAKTIVKGHRRR
ncbi:hypothetical protein BJ912DRAFT_955076 [Pholiota molesta]|nr:hypothetical protein BJ912DRAFT_955076 [Pholiota molesta]